MSDSEKKPAKSKPSLIVLELNPASGVDVLGDQPVLWQGMDREFTPSEAADLLALRNSHGTPICRVVKDESK